MNLLIDDLLGEMLTRMMCELTMDGKGISLSSQVWKLKGKDQQEKCLG